MQAWALQQVLKRMGHDPNTIDRQPDPKSQAYRCASLVYRTVMKMTGRRKAPINFERHLPFILQNTKAFIDHNIAMSERLDSSGKLQTHFDREKYDTVIVGSDQTWRPKYSPNIENFFLDFLEGVDIRRIAYASSFGVDDWEFTDKQTSHCAALATRFDAISVREKSAVALCRTHLDVDVELVLDPTLLLRPSDYEALLSDDVSLSSGKVFRYILDNNDTKNRIVSEIASVFSKPVFHSQPLNDFQGSEAVSLADYKYPRVQDWLMSFRDADFVITDSFHGSVFSIIFNRPFVAIGNKERGLSRFQSLLSGLGLEDRLMIDGEVFDQKILATEINWEKVNLKLDNYRIKSMGYLKEWL